MPRRWRTCLLARPCRICGRCRCFLKDNISVQRGLLFLGLRFFGDAGNAGKERRPYRGMKCRKFFRILVLVGEVHALEEQVIDVHALIHAWCSHIRMLFFVCRRLYQIFQYDGWPYCEYDIACARACLQLSCGQKIYFCSSVRAMKSCCSKLGIFSQITASPIAYGDGQA